jgi:signal transduction histidine kinase
MSTPITKLQHDTVAPLTHIFLSLDLLEAGPMNDENRSYLTIIRQNTERLQLLIKRHTSEVITV